MTKSSPEIEDFLAALPDEQRALLRSLRETIRAAAPEATEKIGYGVPAFYYMGRPLVSYAAAKAHYSFYVQSPAVMEAYRDELEGFDTSKGTVRFTADRPLPAELIEKLVQARLAETDATE